MAVKANIDFQGIPLTNAYIRLYRFSGGKSEGSIIYLYQLVASEAAAKPEPITEEVPDGVDEDGAPKTRTVERAVAPKLVTEWAGKVPYAAGMSVEAEIYADIKTQLAERGASAIADC